jgi:uncharacterized protein
VPILTEDVHAVIEAAHLAFVATVTPEGNPNLSPKGTLHAWDDDRVYFLDIASPKTRANLTRNPKVEINVVDQLSRRGYRLFGTATLHYEGSDVYDEAMARLFVDSAIPYAVACVVLVDVERAEPVYSPAYARIETEAEMRDTWRQRRRALDDAFDEHCRASPFEPPHGERRA